MFRHQGKSRKSLHNLQLASLLSFVAGIVNVAGFLSVKTLTTNITGHFAFFVDAVFQYQFQSAFVYFMFVFAFFFGAFISSFLVEFFYYKNQKKNFVVPLIIEIILLFFIAFFGNIFLVKFPEVIAFILLFAMGLQNSLVTKISNAVVRTTHLTGLVTDLGIELSQLLFYKDTAVQQELLSSIKLRLTIIGCFFIGGIISGLFYNFIELKVLFIAILCLVFGLFYDYKYYLRIKTFINR